MGIFIEFFIILLIIGIIMLLTGGIPLIICGIVFSILSSLFLIFFFEKYNNDDEFKKRQLNNRKMWNNQYLKITMQNGEEEVYEFNISDYTKYKKFKDEAEDRMRLWTPENERVKSLTKITWIQYTDFIDNRKEQELCETD